MIKLLIPLKLLIHVLLWEKKYYSFQSYLLVLFYVTMCFSFLFRFDEKKIFLLFLFLNAFTYSEALAALRLRRIGNFDPDDSILDNRQKTFLHPNLLFFFALIELMSIVFSLLETMGRFFLERLPSFLKYQFVLFFNKSNLNKNFELNSKQWLKSDISRSCNCAASYYNNQYLFSLHLMI